MFIQFMIINYNDYSFIQLLITLAFKSSFLSNIIGMNFGNINAGINLTGNLKLKIIRKKNYFDS